MSSLISASYFITQYILRTPIEIPKYIYVLMHLLLVIPLNFAGILFALKSMNKPKRIRERRLIIGAVLMLLIVFFRYYITYVQDGYKIVLTNMIKFEMSEMGMYLLLISVFLIKKDWIYPIAFTVGMSSCLAVVFYPYTVLGNFEPFNLYTISSFVFHVLNGYLAVMLIVARGYEPKVKHFIKTSVTSVFLMAFIYATCILMEQNFFVMLDPSNIPVLNLIPAPYHIILIFIAFNAVNALILWVAELAYKKFYLKESKIRPQSI